MIGVLLARQRSGTGALGSILGRHPGLAYVGEVLHPNPERASVGEVLEPGIRSEDVNFFRYLARDPGRLEGFCDPNLRAEGIERYLDWLEERFHPRIPVIDVKYRSLHHWNCGWQGALERPWLIRHCRQKRLPVIHLKRKNLLETYVSGHLAEINQVWHAKSHDEMTTRSMEIDIANLTGWLDETAREVGLVDSWLEGARALADIDYAELFDAKGAADRSVMRRIKRCFKLEQHFPDLTPAFVKQAPAAITASISNPEAVVRALRGGEYAWMLD